MPVTPSGEDLIGKILGPCRIESVLGRGGMGVVYRAQHLRLERPVAVKVLSGAGTGQRLLQEARLAARLEDPRIVSVHDAGQDGELHYIVMQLVDGETLEQRVRRTGALKPAEALRIMKEVLLGLGAAHVMGVVHRDIKPANIMLEPGGGVKIMDFGVSAGMAPSSVAGAQDVVGSWDFMPPEQGVGAAPSPLMDLYSFGATYFYVLTGAPPYSGASAAEQMILHRDAPVPDVRERRPEATAKLAALLCRLMQKAPESRPPSAEAVLAELGSHGILLEVDSSGSPFSLLPPPLEPKEEGFVPPAAAAEEGSPVGAAQAPLRAPPRPKEPGRLPAYAACFVIAAAFLPLWRKVVPLDWVAAAAAAALIAGRLIWVAGGSSGRRWAGTAAWAGLIVFLGLYAWTVTVSWSLETGIFLGLGLALGAASLGLTAHPTDRWTATALLAASMAVLLAAAAGVGQEGLAGAWASLARDTRLFVATAGPWRWGGLLLVWGAWLLLRPRSARKAPRIEPPKIRNWNK
jgi:hypothetical protein